MSGKYAVHTTRNKFFVMVHQHNDAYVKGSDNQGALRWRMITGPELGKIHLEVEEQTTKFMMVLMIPDTSIAKTSNLECRQHASRRIRHLWQCWKRWEIHFQNTMLTDYFHNYAEIVRMVMTIVGYSLHQVCDGNSRKVYNTCLTYKYFKISTCHCSEIYRMRLSQLRRHSLQ